MTREEFVNLLDSNSIDSVPVYYGEEYVGKVDFRLNYDHKNCWRYLTDPDYAVQLAMLYAETYVENVKKFRSHEVITLEIEYYRDYDKWEYADADGVVRHHVYPRKFHDVRKSSKTGTMDELFQSVEVANNRLRYCNGTGYTFADKSIRKLYQEWQRWIPESRSFDLYYGNGTVD